MSKDRNFPDRSDHLVCGYVIGPKNLVEKNFPYNNGTTGLMKLTSLCIYSKASTQGNSVVLNIYCKVVFVTGTEGLGSRLLLAQIDVVET
jgi:hypothetical protein